MKNKIIAFMLIVTTITIVFYQIQASCSEYDGGYLYDDRQELAINSPLYQTIKKLRVDYNYSADNYECVAYRSFNNYYIVMFVPKNLQIRAIFNYGYNNNISYRNMTLGFFNSNNQQVYKDGSTNVYFRLTSEIERVESTSQNLTVTSQLQTIDYPLPNDGIDIDINMVRIIENLGLFNSSEIYAYNTRNFSDAPTENNSQYWRIIRKNWIGGYGLLTPGQPDWTDYVGVSIGDPYQYTTPHQDGELPWWDKVQQAFEDVEDITDIPTLLKNLFSLVLEGLMNIGDSILNLPLNISDYLYRLFVPSSEMIQEWQNNINDISEDVTTKIQPLRNWIISNNNAGYPPPLHSVKLTGSTIQSDNEHILIDWYSMASYVVPYQYVIHIFITLSICIMSVNFIYETFDIKSKLSLDEKGA